MVDRWFTVRMRPGLTGAALPSAGCLVAAGGGDFVVGAGPAGADAGAFAAAAVPWLVGVLFLALAALNSS